MLLTFDRHARLIWDASGSEVQVNSVAMSGIYRNARVQMSHSMVAGYERETVACFVHILLDTTRLVTKSPRSPRLPMHLSRCLQPTLPGNAGWIAAGEGRVTSQPLQNAA